MFVHRDSGFTLVELLVVVSIVGLLATAAMVGYSHARIRSAEAAAITALTALNRAQFAYMQTCGSQRYAPTFVDLGTPPPGDDRGFVSPDLATADPLLKSGYVFTMSGTPAVEGEPTCTGAAPLDTYRITADPVRPGQSGGQYFGTNTDRVIYGDSATYAQDMPETGAPGRGREIR